MLFLWCEDVYDSGAIMNNVFSHLWKILVKITSCSIMASTASWLHSCTVRCQKGTVKTKVIPLAQSCDTVHTVTGQTNYQKVSERYDNYAQITLHFE